MNLKEIQQEARAAAGDLTIGWEKLASDPEYKEDFERMLSQVAELLPEIEALYMKLEAGENVLHPDKATTISLEEREMFMERLEDELFASYQVLDLWERYQLIERITSL